MRLRGRLTLGAAVAATLVGIAGAADGLAAHLDRLSQLPLERRQALLTNLKRFDALPADRREAIRQLDRQIAELPEADQARYRLVLRRYDLWLRGLSEESRKKLQDAPPVERLELVRTYLAQTPPAAWARLDELLFLGSTLNSTPLFEQAHAIATWLVLDPPARADVEKQPAGRRRTRLLELGQQLGVPDPRPAGARKVEDRIRENLREHLKKFDQLKAPQKIAAVRRVAEAQYLRRSPHDPVEPSRLARFTAALPGWLLEPLDDLPPGVARKRLEVLYRLAFPGGEMPEPVPDAKAPPAKSSAPASPSATPL